MILKLRKRHRYIWIVLAVILPVLFFAGYYSHEEINVSGQQLVEPERSIPGQLVIAMADTDELTARISSDIARQYWLDLHLKKGSAHPLSTVYLSSADDTPVEQRQALGPLDAKRNYQYLLDSTIQSWNNYYLAFYDQLRSDIFLEIRLQKK